MEQMPSFTFDSLLSKLYLYILKNISFERHICLFDYESNFFRTLSQGSFDTMLLFHKIVF